MNYVMLFRRTMFNVGFLVGLLCQSAVNAMVPGVPNGWFPTGGTFQPNNLVLPNHTAHYLAPQAAGGIPTLALYAANASRLPNNTRGVSVVTSNVESFSHYWDTRYDMKDLAKKLRMSDELRVEKFRAFVNSTEADVYCLQEFDKKPDNKGWMDYVQAAPELAHYSIIHSLVTNLVILFNPNKLTLVAATLKKEARMQAALFSVNGQPLVVLNNHAKFNEMPRLKGDYQEVLASVAGLPIVAMGDWNTDYGKDPEKFDPRKGNENLVMLRTILFSAPVWQELASNIALTTRSPIARDAFETVDYAFGFDVRLMAPAQSFPDEKHRHLLLPLTNDLCYDNKDRRTPVYHANRLRMEGIVTNGVSMPGSLTVVDQSSGGYTQGDPRNHFSDHAAIMFTVDFGGASAIRSVKQAPVVCDRTEEEDDSDDERPVRGGRRLEPQKRPPVKISTAVMPRQQVSATASNGELYTRKDDTFGVIMFTPAGVLVQQTATGFVNVVPIYTGHNLVVPIDQAKGSHLTFQARDTATKGHPKPTGFTSVLRDAKGNAYVWHSGQRDYVRFP